MVKFARITLPFFSLSFILFSSCSVRNISGTYRSKFASLGMFGTTVRLKPDSALEYVFQGDLIYDSATGHYQVYGNKVYALFDNDPGDTTAGITNYFQLISRQRKR